MIDLPFMNINMLFFLSFKAGHNISKRDSYDKYYMPLIKIKVFNSLIDNKPFFDQLVKNKNEAYEKLVEISRNDVYGTRNLLDCSYNQNYYKLIGIDLSGQTNTAMFKKHI